MLVTGGAGFIGSAFIRYGLKHIKSVEALINLDLLTYAGNTKNLASIERDPRYTFVRGDICDESLVDKLCREHEIQTIVHFAAESHVDRSIDNAHPFYKTNIGGTLSLLEVVRRHPHIHFHHISTDEVYGSLNMNDSHFHEDSPYRPNSPYAASKAASDHFVRAFANTYNLSTTISHASNNYGPYQFPEKFIPVMIAHLLHKRPLPIYGKGVNVRDWLFVDDHAEALWALLDQAQRGETYAIGGSCEKKNIDLVHLIIEEFAKIRSEEKQPYERLISYVSDRPGHDLRYALNSQKIEHDLGWRPAHDLSSGLHKTIAWYLDNPDWLTNAR